MKIVSVANRAPSYEKTFGRRASQVVPNPISVDKQRDMEWNGALKSIEFVKNKRSLPRGFSQRRFFDEIARDISAKIVSEHQGRIEKLLISIPYTGAELNRLHARHYGALFAGIGSSCNFVIVCHPKNEDEIVALAAQAGLPRARLNFVYSPKFDYTIWAQDAYVALNDSTGSEILLEGVCFPRGDDMTIADDVAVQSATSCLQSDLYFQGGNVLGSKDLTLIGLDYVMHNVGRYGLETMEAVIERFENAFGTEVMPLGGDLSAHEKWYKKGILSGHGYQPIFHIDMYVTPTGVIGDSGKEIVFLGRPEAAKAVVGRYSDVSELNNAKYNALFDETERILSTRFEVRYLPLWITHGSLGQPQFEGRYYNLTFNNCIVQCSAQGKSVLLPTYSSDAEMFGTDQSVRTAIELAAIDEWKKIGFDIKLMDGVEDLAYASGVVHCITKTLKRTST